MTPADSQPPPRRGPDEVVELAAGHGAVVHAVELGVLLTEGDASRLRELQAAA